MRVNETKKRSVLKTVSVWALEVAIDVGILTYIFAFLGPLATAVTIEGICIAVHYAIERLWNRNQWGRTIERD